MKHKKLMRHTHPALQIMLLAVLSGCSGQVVHLQNDKGESVTCEVSQTTALWFGIVTRDVMINECVQKYEKAGYKKVD